MSYPSGFHGIVYNALFIPFAFCIRLARGLRLDLWIIQGTEKGSKLPLTIACATDIRSRNYLTGLIYEGQVIENHIGKTWCWNIKNTINKTTKNCSILILEIYKFVGFLLYYRKWFYIPCWVIGKVKIPLMDSVFSDVHRRIRKNALQPERCKDDASFDDFFENMYLPYITFAHGKGAYFEPRDSLKRGLIQGELIFVVKNGKRIGGMIIIDDKAMPRIWCLGIRDGNPQYLTDGAIGALYYFSLKYLEEKRFNYVNLGRSRAFLKDGVLRYKQKMSQSLIGASNYGFALKPFEKNPAVRSFLCHNPFIVEHFGKLAGICFTEMRKPFTQKELSGFVDKFLYNGLSKLTVNRFYGNAEFEAEPIPAQWADRMALHSY